MAESYISDAMLREVALTREEYDTIVAGLGRPPNAVDLGMFGAMWSEHCGYKNSKPLLGRFPTTGPGVLQGPGENAGAVDIGDGQARSEEHTSELQSRFDLVCRLLLEKKKTKPSHHIVLVKVRYRDHKSL